MLIIKKKRWLGSFEHSGLDKIKTCKWFAHDTETTGLNPWTSENGAHPARPFFFSFSTPDQEIGWMRLPIDPTTRRVDMPDEARRLLQEIYGRKCEKVAHNAPFDHHMVTLSGIRIESQELCSMIGMQIISPNEFSFQLKPLCKKFFGIAEEDESLLHASILKARNRQKHSPAGSWERSWILSEDVKADMCYGDPELLKEYACTDAVRAAVMRITQLEYFATNPGQAKVYAAEMELMKTILNMESKGVRIDQDRSTELVKFYTDIRDRHQSAIDEECPGLNVNSPKQMVREFFGKRKYTPLKYAVRKDKTGAPVPCQECKTKDNTSRGLGCKLCQGTGHNPKCDGEFLEHIGLERKGDEVTVKDRLAYEVLHAKAAGTMLNYVTQYINLSSHEDGMMVLRPHFKQSEARTGRMSCEDPNLQNVASDESGKKKANIPYRTREVFIPRPGRLFHIPDYSQIEVWILALLSKDDAFINALCSGDDAHLAVAKIIWPDGCDFDMAKADKNKAVVDLTPVRADNLKRYNKIRKRAKNLQFCKIYGGGAAKIAGMVGCSVAEAKKFINDYDLRLPAVPRFMAESIAIAKSKGVVTDPYGRDYPIDRGFEYRATNYLVQGTAAGVAKGAMRRVDRILSTKWECRADLLLQIHDEFLIEVDKDIDCAALRQDVVRAMSFDYKTLGCPIPFPVGYKIATERWSVNQEVEVAA